MDRLPNIDKITKFKDIVNWIWYDWDSQYNLYKDEEGNFYVNKLYIEPKYLTYKTECAELADGLFEKVEKLYEALREE